MDKYIVGKGGPFFSGWQIVGQGVQNLRFLIYIAIAIKVTDEQ